jgi:hypothetical protein
MKIDQILNDRLLKATVQAKTNCPEITGILHSLWYDGSTLCLETFSGRLRQARTEAQGLLNAIEAAERALPVTTFILSEDAA